MTDHTLPVGIWIGLESARQRCYTHLLSLHVMRTKKDTMRTCVHGAITKHIAFRVIYIITYFVQKVNILVDFVMVFKN